MTKQELQKNFDEFFKTFNNQGVEVVDANAYNQCVDLAVAWVDWLGISRQTTAKYYAYQIYTDTPQYVLSYMDRIANTPDAVPQKGDIVVWNKTYNGGPGHVGIATGNGDLNTLEAFEQNDPTGTVSHLKTYNYNHVLGWLRLKTTGNVTSSPTPSMPTAFEVKKSGQVDKVAQWLVDIKEATDAGTEQYFDNSQDPDEFLNKIKAVYAKAKSQASDPNAQAKIQEAKDAGYKSGFEDGKKKIKDAVAVL